MVSSRASENSAGTFVFFNVSARVTPEERARLSRLVPGDG